MKYLLILISLSISLELLAQEKLSYQQACADIDYYFTKIDSIHPNMYWHTSKERVDSFIRALKERLPDTVSVNQLGYELKLSNHFWDYHTNIHFELENNVRVFPMTDLRPEGLFFQHKKILSVNNVKVEDIYSVLNKFNGCDVPLPTFYYYINHSASVSFAMYGLGLKAPYQVVFEGTDPLMTVEGVLYRDLRYV